MEAIQELLLCHFWPSVTWAAASNGYSMVRFELTQHPCHRLLLLMMLETNQAVNST